MEKRHYIVLCTCPDEASARRIAEHLVERRLAACVNLIAGVRSVYVWQGETETASEVQLVIKTSVARYDAVERQIQHLHPYELPEIVAVPIMAGLEGYLEWIDSSTATPTHH